MRIDRQLIAALVALLALSSAARAWAETSVAPEAQPASLLTRLGTPARDVVVEEALAALEAADTGAAVRLASALGHAGGCAAGEGICALLAHGAEEVRLAAIDAAGRLNLRMDALARLLRRTIEEGRGRERLAAIEAIGRAGDGRDAALLLVVASEDDARHRAAAFRSLAQLTGAHVPFVHARWSYYWKGFHKRAALLLPQTLEALADAPDAADAASLVDLVRRYGWVDLPATRTTLREWMASPDHDLRAIACTLVADLRLADLAPEVEMTLHFAGRRNHAEVAQNALDALGVRYTAPVK